MRCAAASRRCVIAWWLCRGSDGLLCGWVEMWFLGKESDLPVAGSKDSGKVELVDHRMVEKAWKRTHPEEGLQVLAQLVSRV